MPFQAPGPLNHHPYVSVQILSVSMPSPHPWPAAACLYKDTCHSCPPPNRNQDKVNQVPHAPLILAQGLRTKTFTPLSCMFCLYSTTPPSCIPHMLVDLQVECTCQSACQSAPNHGNLNGISQPYCALNRSTAAAPGAHRDHRLHRP